ncbi:MAG: flagellar FliJ family protein [Gemmatimonadota bacterium]
MKRFTFRLERVLELRSAAERQQAGVVGEAASLESARRRATDASEAHLGTVHEQLSGTGMIAAGMRCALGLSAVAAAHNVAAARDALAEAATQQHEALERFAEMRTARMSIERLRERQSAEWSVAELRSDQADNDEVARQLHAGQRGGA